MWTSKFLSWNKCFVVLPLGKWRDIWLWRGEWKKESNRVPLCKMFWSLLQIPQEIDCEMKIRAQEAYWWVLRGSHLWGREASRWTLRQSQQRPHPIPLGALELGCSFRIVPNWSKEPCLNTLCWPILGSGLPSGNNLGQGGFLLLRAILPEKLSWKPSAVYTASPEGRVWVVPLSILSIIFYKLLGYLYPLYKLVI